MVHYNTICQRRYSVAETSTESDAQENIMRMFLSLTLALMLLPLSGCVIVNGEPGWVGSSDWEDEERDNREAISHLEIGSARTEIIGQLGTPSFSEAFTRDGEEYRVLFYRTQRRHSDGDTSRDETTPLIFRGDALIGWGDDVLASMR